LLYILQFFSAEELVMLQLVCKTLQTLAVDDQIWTKLCKDQNPNYKFNEGNIAPVRYYGNNQKSVCWFDSATEKLIPSRDAYFPF